MEMVRLTQLCEAVAARVTVLIYPVDEVSDMDASLKLSKRWEIPWIG